MKYYLAIDIGASSGRHIVGWKEDGEIRTEEVYRFPNGMKEEGGHLVWDPSALFAHVKAGIAAAFLKYPKIESLAVDTWGVDYVLMNGEEEILPCYAYRDSRTERSIPKVHGKLPFDRLYARTGICFQPFNTIYQLYADLQAGRLEGATDFLFLPEYLSYKLTGVKAHEYTIASTSGLLRTGGGFDLDIIDVLGLPGRLFEEADRPGTPLGRLKSEIAAETGGDCEVVFCASHDTASAVEAIPMTDCDLFLSSGTWSLLGAKLPKAHISEFGRESGYSNEGGAGYICYLQNITGMWIPNRLKAELCPEAGYDEIERAARESKFQGIIDCTHPSFSAPERMREAFDAWFAGGEKPRDAGDYFRCAYRSLAARYGRAVEELERDLGRTFETLYVVGGGAKNRFLNELTEQACRKRVVALPIEATAIGNLNVQMKRK